MLQLTGIRIENAESGVITDSKSPRFSFSLASDRQGARLEKYRITVASEEKTVWDSGILLDKRQIGIPYTGNPLKHFTAYEVRIAAEDQFGEQAESTAAFSTGRLDTPWQARWITDMAVPIPEKSSPVPLLFHKAFAIKELPVRAWITATALGIYNLCVNGEKQGDRYFAPGFTSYLHQIQYQTYPVANLKTGENAITVRVGAGWAVGTFSFRRTNKTFADTPSLLLELWLEYADGHTEVIGTDESWQVSLEGCMRFADWYDGEVYDATVDENTIAYHPVDVTKPRTDMAILAEYGVPVRAIRTLTPVAVFSSPNGERIYDFGQNFSGVISAQIRGKKGQRIIFRHAEVMANDELFVKPLRTAKARVKYICREGDQRYTPSMTCMGFRYVGVKGIKEQDLQLSALVVSSDMEETGRFTCSDTRLNQLQHNIQWGGRSNFVDIPTDCPQRDERMGWTGDLAVFARTACFNFDMSRFLEKWLLDLSSEQTESGALPMTCPRADDGWKKRATGCWGDACVLVPWAEYLARGDEEILRRHYPMMKRFLGEAERRASLFSVGRHKRIWSLPFQFGDWCAPDEDFIHWVLKGKWVATAYFANSCRIVSQIASILGCREEAKQYQSLYKEISDAYMTLLCRKNGRLKKEFQTAYVLPLAFEIAKDEQEQTMASRLAEMVKDAGWSPRTGFPGTPWLLFALSDHGQQKAAFNTLLDEGCPGWLYAVKAGATTIWERWDTLKPDGTVNVGEHGGDDGMVSFNHYANGAVGDFLYRRVAGLEPIEGGYRRFRVAPMIGGGIIHAEAEILSPYGLIRAAWRIENEQFVQEVQVPVSAECLVRLPSGKEETLTSGSHILRETYKGGRQYG